MRGLNDIGNPNAPIGSRDWRQAFVLQAQSLLRDAKTKVGNLRETLTSLHDQAYYQGLENRHGRPFTDWEEFCREHPPWGLGMSPAVAEAVIRERDSEKLLSTVAAEVMARAEPAKTHAEAGMMGGRGKKAVDNGKELSGNSSAYIASRLKRDYPDIAEAVERGEIKTIRQAGVKAGIVKSRKVATLGDPQRLAQRILDEGVDFALGVREHLDALLQSLTV